MIAFKIRQNSKIQSAHENRGNLGWRGEMGEGVVSVFYKNLQKNERIRIIKNTLWLV